MKLVTLAGLVLIVLGIVGLAAGHFSYTTQKQVVDLGPVKASVAQEHTLDIPDIAGVGAILAGIVLVFISRRVV
jgi:multidrug transporter EmrE-like cation transporter